MKRLGALIVAVMLLFAGCGGAKVPQQLQKPAKGEKIAIMKTTMGDIKIRFFAKEAPKAVENFIGLAEKGYYNGIIFHRVIKDFMIQGGDPTGTGTGGESIWGADFEDEFNENLHNLRGTLSMANSGANTNGSQFFIVHAPAQQKELTEWMKSQGYPQELVELYQKYGGTPWLDNKHTVFGQVMEGMDVVDKIASVKTTGSPEDRPIEEVKINSVEITEMK